MDEETGIDLEELQALVRSEAEDAIEFIEEYIGHKRAESTEYYRGDPFGNEEEGRSQIVSRDVRDAVQSILPSLMRVFCGSERAVEFMPRSAEDVAMAEQATDYINYVILQDNPGFEIMYTAFKDALYNKVGVIKYWLDESIEVTYHDFSGLTDAALAQVMQEPSGTVEITEIDTQQVPAGAPDLPPLQIHDVTVRRTRRAPRIRIMAVPGEEFIIDRRTRSIDEARYVAHRQLMAVTDLVALGYDREFVEGHISHSESFEDSHEVYTRYRNQGGYWNETLLNKEEKPVLYTEHWLRVDWDGDGIAELRKICTVGEQYEIVDIQPATDRPFASFTPDPEPHLFFGSDIADLTKDLQWIATNIKRSILDSLAQSIFPRTAVVEGRVDLDSVLNNEIGAVMLQDMPGMITPFVTPFVGKEALPVLEMVEAEKDRRVGTHNIALDADALQSTTKNAVNAQIDAARQRIELISRVFAESGMKRLFSGLLKLSHAHQDVPRMVRLRNQWVEVDPRSWNADMDVQVNVGLGNGMAEDRIAALQQVLGVQREIMQQYGPSNPLVGIGQVRNTLGKMLEQSGFKDTAQFFKPMPIDQEIPPAPPAPDPSMELVKVEQQKVQLEAQEAMAKAALERDKLLADTILRAKEIEAKHNVTIDMEEIKQAFATDQIQVVA